MSRLMKLSFNLLQVSCMGYTAAYLVVTLTAATYGFGHEFMDLNHLLIVLLSSLLLVLLLHSYKKSIVLNKKPNVFVKWLLLFLLPPLIGMSCLLTIVSVVDLNSFSELFLLLVFLTTAATGIIVFIYMI